MSARYEDEKDRYSEQLTAARARLGKAKDEVKAVKAELAAQLARTAEAELEAEKVRADVERLKAELKAASDGQGEALRAYTKRLLLSEHFSGLANELAGLINGNAAVDVLEEAAKDFPDLDVSKYGYERLEGAALFSRYAEVIRGHLGHLPILNELASSAGLLNAEQVAACPTDRDPDLDAAFEALPDEIEGEEEQGGWGEDPGFPKRAEVLKTSGAEEIAEESSSGQPPTPEKETSESSDVTTLRMQITQLSQDLIDQRSLTQLWMDKCRRAEAVFNSKCAFLKKKEAELDEWRINNGLICEAAEAKLLADRGKLMSYTSSFFRQRKLWKLPEVELSVSS